MAEEKSPLDGKTVLMRSDAAFKKKDPWIPVLRDMYELTMASRNPYMSAHSVEGSMDRQFDSTAPSALVKAANRLMSELVPPEQTWHSLDIGPGLAYRKDVDETQKKTLREALMKTTALTQVVFSSGSFVNSLWEVFIEMLGGVMGCLLVLENPVDDIEPVSFQCVSQAEIAIEIDGRGKNCGVYRKRSGVKIRNIKELWSDAIIPKELSDKMKQNDRKNKDPECNLMESTYRIPNSGGKWAYVIHWRKGDNDPVEVVSREYDENPWVIFQWSRMPGSPYGPGPGILLLPAIRMVNKVREMLIMNAALALSGMYLAKDDDVLNIDNVQIIQGGIIPVGATGGSTGASLVPLPTGRDFNVAQIVLAEEQDIIRKGLFDNGLPDPADGVRSPTEIIERVRELAQDIGGAIGRLTRSLVELVVRVVGILKRRGLVPDVTLDQFNFKVQIKSPLARAQQLQEVQNMLQWWQMVVSLVGPQLAMVFVNVEKFIDWIAERMGVPEFLLRDEADKQQIQQNIAQIVAAQQAAAMPAAAPAALGA